jgi:hypothetical protein
VDQLTVQPQPVLIVRAQQETDLLIARHVVSSA